MKKPFNDPSNRDENGKFVKGHTGNPTGRKKVPEDVRKMLSSSAPDAVKLLVDTVNNENARLDLRIKCAETVLERVYGKAVQPIEGNMENKIEIVMGGAERYAD